MKITHALVVLGLLLYSTSAHSLDNFKQYMGQGELKLKLCDFIGCLRLPETTMD